MAAYCRVYDSPHLQADCQEPRSAPLRNPTFGNRVWATFTFLCILASVLTTCFVFLGIFFNRPFSVLRGGR